MKAKIKYLPTAGDVKELVVSGFKNFYVYDNAIEVKVENDGIENSIRVTMASFISITIDK